MRADVIVIGGGIAGVSIAWHLARRGKRVHLLERQNFGAEASGGLAGLLTTTADGQEDGPYAELSRLGLDATLRAVAQLESETGVDVELSSHPLLRLASDDPSCRMLRDFSQRPSAAADGEVWLDESDLRKLLAELAPRIKGAILLPQARHLNPRQFMAAMLEAARRSGVVEHCPVEAVSLLRRGNTIEGIIDSSGRRRFADHVIVANGIWGRDLLQTIGIDLPLRPVRGQILALDGSAGPELPFIISPGHGYVVPKSDRRIV